MLGEIFLLGLLLSTADAAPDLTVVQIQVKILSSSLFFIKLHSSTATLYQNPLIQQMNHFIKEMKHLKLFGVFIAHRFNITLTSTVD